jgi:hypothetical protein
MDFTTAVSVVNKNFTYKADNKTIDQWKIHNANVPFEGDCENYCLGILFLIYGGWWNVVKSLMSGEANIWYVLVNGEGHAVLEYKGTFIECIYKTPSTTKFAQFRWKYKFNKFVIGSKLLVGCVV